MGITIGVIIAFLIYGGILAFISIKANKTARSSDEDYLVAGRSASPITMVGTLCLSIWSALAFFGYGAGLYRDGIGYFAGAVGAYFVGLYAPTLMYRLWLLGKRYHYSTPGDFFYHRYQSKTLRIIISVVSIVCIMPYISVQMTGIANGITTVTGGNLSFWVVIAIVTVFILGVVIFGGNKSVVSADTVAGFVGITIVVVTTVVFISNISGDLQTATQTVLRNKPEVFRMTGAYAGFLGFFGLAMSAGMSIISWPHIFVKSYMAKTEATFKAMAVAFPLLELLAFGAFMLQGIWGGQSAFPGLDRAASDLVIPMIASTYAPAILAVALVIGVFAFGLSTADSQMIVAASILTHDVLPEDQKSKKSASQRMIPCILVMMVVILVIVKFRPEFLVTYAYGFCAPGFAQMLPAMVGGLYWKRGTKQGAIAGTLGGCAAVLITLFGFNPLPAMQPILWGLLVNLILYIVVSLATKEEEKATLEIYEPLRAFFKSRNTTGHIVLMVLAVLAFIQLIVLSPYLPSTILFGWCPLPVLNWILGAFELAVLGFFYSKNRLHEPDGSTKEFPGLVEKTK